MGQYVLNISKKARLEGKIEGEYTTSITSI